MSIKSSIRLVVLDTIRKTPNKFMIIFFAFVIIGILSPRWKIISAYREYRVKYVENRRIKVFRLACEINK